MNIFDSKSRQILGAAHRVGRCTGCRLGCQLRPERWYLCASDDPTPGAEAFREAAVKVLAALLEEGAKLERELAAVALQDRSSANGVPIAAVEALHRASNDLASNKL
jgi:hypothetical protein